jgi:hypothetical protein
MSANLVFDDMHRIITMMPKDIRVLLERENVFLAGGAIRSLIAGEAVSDWDIFGPSTAQLELLGRRLAEDRKGVFHKSKNAFTIIAPPRIPVQFIHRWLYSEAGPLSESFDFTIARAVVWHADGEWRSTCDALFYADLAAKRIRYMAPDRNEDAGGSMLRAMKFAHRGYHIAPESLGKVMARLTCKMREDGLGQTEADQGRLLTGLLRDVDPLLVVDGLEMRDPDDENEGEAA